MLANATRALSVSVSTLLDAVAAAAAGGDISTGKVNTHTGGAAGTCLTPLTVIVRAPALPAATFRGLRASRLTITVIRGN